MELIGLCIFLNTSDDEGEVNTKLAPEEQSRRFVFIFYYKIVLLYREIVHSDFQKIFAK